MSIFDDAQYKMMAKRGDRLKESQKKAKLDALRPSYATYQGRDPNDGTDIVQVGASEPTSGFRLISNASMAIGDRVALRKNNEGGLQRVDDRNRSTVETIINDLTIGITVSGGWFGSEDLKGYPVGYDNIENIVYRYENNVLVSFTPFTLSNIVKKSVLDPHVLAITGKSAASVGYDVLEIPDPQFFCLISLLLTTTTRQTVRITPLFFADDQTAETVTIDGIETNSKSFTLQPNRLVNTVMLGGGAFNTSNSEASVGFNLRVQQST